MVITCPVRNLALSDDKNRARSATSAGSAIYPSGVASIIESCSSGLLCRFNRKLELIMLPRDIALTLIPSFASDTESDLVIWFKAAQLTEYGIISGIV